VAVPLTNQWTEVDLGLVEVPAAVLGTQRWEGRVEFVGTSAVVGAALDLDVLFLVPAERYFKHRAPTVDLPPTEFVGRDEFDQIAGNLDTPKAAPIGGNWAEAVRTGANGFVVEISGKTAQRTTVADADLQSGSYAVLGATSYGGSQVSAEIKYTAFSTTPGAALLARFGVLLRYVDSNNYLLAFIDPVSTFAGRLTVLKRVGTAPGTITTLAYSPSTEELAKTTGVFHKITLAATTAGNWKATLGIGSGDPGAMDATLEGFDADLAAGAALASGKFGMYDAITNATGPTRNYDNFAAWVSPVDHAIWSGRTLELRHDDALRQNSTGTLYGRPSLSRGARIFIPQAGDEAKVTRVAIKARRNDVDELPDSNIADSTTVQVKWTPRYLIPPG